VTAFATKLSQRKS